MENLKQLIKEFRELRNATNSKFESQGDCNRLFIDDDPQYWAFNMPKKDADLIEKLNDLPKLLDAMDVLVEGLEFYKNGNNWSDPQGSGFHTVCHNDVIFDPSIKIGGKRATEALQLAEEKVSNG